MVDFSKNIYSGTTTFMVMERYQLFSKRLLAHVSTTFYFEVCISVFFRNRSCRLATTWTVPNPDQGISLDANGTMRQRYFSLESAPQHFNVSVLDMN